VKTKTKVLGIIAGLIAAFYAWREGILDPFLSDEMFCVRVYYKNQKAYDDYQLKQMREKGATRATVMQAVANEAAQVKAKALPFPYAGSVQWWAANYKTAQVKLSVFLPSIKI